MHVAQLLSFCPAHRNSGYGPQHSIQPGEVLHHLYVESRLAQMLSNPPASAPSKCAPLHPQVSRSFQV